MSKPFSRSTHSGKVLLGVTLGLLIPQMALSQSLPPLQPNNAYTPYGNTYDNSYGATTQAPLQGRVVSAPAGTYVMASVNRPISSEYARVGDRFTATLGTAIMGSDGSIILPAGSALDGQVVMVKPAGRTGKNGELDIRFTSAMLPNGQRVPLSARVQTEDGSGVIKGGTNKERLKDAAVNTAVGAGLGAALGTAMGPLSGGKVGRGAIYGTAIGGGAGLLKSAWEKGEDAVIQAGQPVNIVLDQPLTVTPPAGGYSTPAYAQPTNYNNSQPYANPQPYSPYGNTQPNYSPPAYNNSY